MLKLRESIKRYLHDAENWQPSYYAELMVDTLSLMTGPQSEISELQAWYTTCSIQEQVHATYKISTEDKNMMRSVDALQAGAEATQGENWSRDCHSRHASYTVARMAARSHWQVWTTHL